MKIFSIVMAHTEIVQTVKNHLPIWLGVTDHLIFTSPEDRYMSNDLYCLGYPEIKIGKAEHHGEISAQRIIGIFNYVVEYYCSKNWDTITHFLLMEYDSFATAIPEDVIPEAGGVSAIRYPQNKPIKFKGKFYLHYPMLFTKEGFKKVAEYLPEVKTQDRHFSDRFIGKAVELSGIPVKDLLRIKRGYSKNTIEPKHHTELRKAVENGAVFFHGVKSEEVLKIIIER